MGYYWGLYVNYWRLFLKRLAEYRADTLIMIGGMAISELATLLFLGAIFSNIEQLHGWSYAEVLMIYGLLSLARGVWNVTLDVPHSVGWYVQGGGLDYLLVRPTNILFQMVGERGLNPTSLGRVLISVIAIVVAVRASGATIAWWWVLYLPAVTISSVLLTFSLYLLLATLSFWFTHVSSLLVSLHLVSQLGQFPVTIFSPLLQFALTWILPFALTGFYPMAFLLRGDPYRLYGWLALIIGWIFLALALMLWRSAIQRYQSTGS